MRKFLILYLATTPVFSWADDTGCARVGASMYIELTASLVHDLQIDPKFLLEKQAKVEVLSISPVSERFADQLAITDSKTRIGIRQDLFDSYYTNGTKSITAKYTFTNGEGKRDVFIASSLMNNDECSVRFNGYLTLSREF